MLSTQNLTPYSTPWNALLESQVGDFLLAYAGAFGRGDRVEVHCTPFSFNRCEYFWNIRFRGSPVRFSMKITTQLLWVVTGSDTCEVIFVGKSYLPGILDPMRSRRGTFHAPFIASRYISGPFDRVEVHFTPLWSCRGTFHTLYYSAHSPRQVPCRVRI